MGDIFNQRIHRLWSQGECITTLNYHANVYDNCPILLHITQHPERIHNIYLVIKQYNYCTHGNVGVT